MHTSSALSLELRASYSAARQNRASEVERTIDTGGGTRPYGSRLVSRKFCLHSEVAHRAYDD
jgi:hypothetical protein